MNKNVKKVLNALTRSFQKPTVLIEKTGLTNSQLFNCLDTLDDMNLVETSWGWEDRPIFLVRLNDNGVRRAFEEGKEGEGVKGLTPFPV